MNDPRYDGTAADAHAPDERTRYDMPTVKRIDPADLRTVQPVDLRTPQARVLDAQARDLRTAGDKIAELVQQGERIKTQLVTLEARLLARDLQQQVSTLQAVCSELSRRVTALEGRG